MSFIFSLSPPLYGTWVQLTKGTTVNWQALLGSMMVNKALTHSSGNGSMEVESTLAKKK